jgi:hypothetical protein
LKLWDTQGYLWLPYDLTEVIKLFGERFEPKIFFFLQKNTLCHSFLIIDIPSVLVSFLPNIVIPSELFTELQILAQKASHTRRARKMATGGGHICKFL